MEFMTMNDVEIFQKTPGFYLDGDYWYAIIYLPESYTEVELMLEVEKDQFKDFPLKKEGDNRFWNFKVSKDHIDLKKVKTGNRYKFTYKKSDGTKHYIQDPAARLVESSNLGDHSKILKNTDYTFTADWNVPGWEHYIIYQVHPKRFSNRNKELSIFKQVMEEIKDGGYIDKLGPTAIEFLPLNEFPGDNSWGYNPAFPYAIESHYGTPQELKELIDLAHSKGIAIIFDLVFNHVSTDDSILASLDFGTYCSGDTGFGAMVHYNNDIARHYFVENVLYLAREYKVDGFRFDLTHLIHAGDRWVRQVNYPGRGGGWNFLKELRKKVKKINNNILLIAEDFAVDGHEKDNWHITNNHTTNWGGDLHGPFDSQWTDEFHDEFKEVLAGGDLDKLYRVFKYYGDEWYNALIYVESHDEVGNENKRVARIAKDGKGWELAQVAAAGTILARGIPMIFMGQEAGEDLQFGQKDNNPYTGRSWWNDRLPLDEYENYRGKIINWYKKIFEIRKGNKAAFAWGSIEVSKINKEKGVVAFTRDNGKYLIVLNFSGETREYENVNVSGFYKEIANTSWPCFNISNQKEVTRQGYEHHHIYDVHVPAYGAVVFERY